MRLGWNFQIKYKFKDHRKNNLDRTEKALPCSTKSTTSSTEKPTKTVLNEVQRTAENAKLKSPASLEYLRKTTQLRF